MLPGVVITFRYTDMLENSPLQSKRNNQIQFTVPVHITNGYVLTVGITRKMNHVVIKVMVPGVLIFRSTGHASASVTQLRSFHEGDDLQSSLGSTGATRVLKNFPISTNKAP